MIFHGFGATPADHWFPWLAGRLAAAGIDTAVPALPDPGAPEPQRWEASVRSALGTPDAGSIVVAHSLGCLAALRCLRSLTGPWRLGSLVLVSGFIERLAALPELDAFVGEGCDVSGLRDHIGHLVVVRSDDDAIVPPALTDRLADRLGVSPRVVAGAGHFLAAEGVRELPVVLDAIGAGMRAAGSS